VKYILLLLCFVGRETVSNWQFDGLGNLTILPTSFFVNIP